MSTHDQAGETDFTTPWEVFKPYFSYLAMFLGMGLISGSIVHVAQEDMREYALVLMGVGAMLFALGSYLNEVLFRTGILGDDVLKYVLLSFLVAIGIGMVSGSAQHFFDTPIFASYLAPIGIFVSSAAFAFRQGYVLHRKNWAFLIVLGLAFAAVSHLALRAYAETLPVSTGHHGVATKLTAEGDHPHDHGAEAVDHHD
jgi:hypothetical protein